MLAIGKANQAPKRPNHEDKIINSGISKRISRKKSKNMARVPLPRPINILMKINAGAVNTRIET